MYWLLVFILLFVLVAADHLADLWYEDGGWDE